MSVETTALNIVLLPDGETSKKAIDLSQQIAESGQSKYVLDGKNNFPHITVYQSAFPVKNLDLINKSLESLANQTKSFEVQLKGFSVLLEFLFWDAVNSPALSALHTAVLNTLNPLREGMMLPEDASRLLLPEVPEVMKESIRIFGYPVAGKLYSPHISLTRFNTQQEAQFAASNLDMSPISFIASTISLANRGQDGTVNHIYSKYTFNS